MKATLLSVAAAIALFGCGKFGDPNERAVYAESGLPVNCRALIGENIKGWRSGHYKPQEALDSIDRNCGADGYNWGK